MDAFELEIEQIEPANLIGLMKTKITAQPAERDQFKSKLVLLALAH